MDTILLSLNSLPSWLDGAIIAMIVSAAVRAMPDPTQPAQGFGQNLYLYVFNVTHILLANFDKVKTANGNKP